MHPHIPHRKTAAGGGAEPEHLAPVLRLVPAMSAESALFRRLGNATAPGAGALAPGLGTPRLGTPGFGTPGFGTGGHGLRGGAARLLGLAGFAVGLLGLLTGLVTLGRVTRAASRTRS